MPRPKANTILRYVIVLIAMPAIILNCINWRSITTPATGTSRTTLPLRGAQGARELPLFDRSPVWLRTCLGWWVATGYGAEKLARCRALQVSRFQGLSAGVWVFCSSSWAVHVYRRLMWAGSESESPLPQIKKQGQWV